MESLEKVLERGVSFYYYLAGYLISDQSDLHLDTSVVVLCLAAMCCTI